MPAFAADTLIACPDGTKPVRNLVPGDHVVTMTGRARIVWTGTRQLHGRVLREGPSLAPISVRLGGFGHGPDLRVAPHSRVTTGIGTLRRAADLVEEGHAEAMPTIACAYVALIFEETELVRANGVWVECLRPDEAPNPEIAATRTQLFRLFPSLAKRSPRMRVVSPRLG